MIRFWTDMLYRQALKRNDKILIGNVETEQPNYVDLADLLKVFSTDDLKEGQEKKYISPQLLRKLKEIGDSNYTLEELARYFYPIDENPAGYLTALSEIAAAKISGALAQGQIPNLPASKINSGSFAASRIADLPASKITSGIFHEDRIPKLPASKIEALSNELGKYILKETIGKANGLAQLDQNLKLLISNIPNLSADKITSGTMAEDRLPNSVLKSTQLINNFNSEDPNAPASANVVRLLKEYVDRLLQNIKLKGNAAAATTGNIALTGEQVIDDFQTAESRILVRAQDNAAENGIYITSDGAWSRTIDADTGEELASATIFVEGGTTYAGGKFYANNNIELGVTDVVWTQIIEDNVSPEALAIAKQEAIAEAKDLAQRYSDAHREDLELQIEDLDEEVLNHEQRISILENAGSNIIEVLQSRELKNEDREKKLLITAHVTLTWPDAGIENFECNFDVDSGGQLIIAGENVDAENGKILEPGKMAHAYSRPDNFKLRLKGDWTE